MRKSKGKFKKIPQDKWQCKHKHSGVPIKVQQKWIWIVSMRMHGWSLASLSGLGIQHCHELWCRSQTQLRSWLLWLWHRLAAVAPIWPLAWELPNAMGMAVKSKKSKKTKKQKTTTNTLFKIYGMPQKQFLEGSSQQYRPSSKKKKNLKSTT